jgi:hypothetical protein
MTVSYHEYLHPAHNRDIYWELSHLSMSSLPFSYNEANMGHTSTIEMKSIKLLIKVKFPQA